MHQPPTLTYRAAGWLIRMRWYLLILGLLGTLGAARSAFLLDFDAQLESLFAKNDELLSNYLDSIRTFGGDEVVVVAYRDPELLTLAGLQRSQRVADAVWAADSRLVNELRVAQGHAVQSIQCLATAPRPSNPISTVPLVQQIRDRPATSQQLREELLGSELLRDVLIGGDAETTALIVTLTPDVGKGKQRRKFIITEIRQAIVDALRPAGISPRIAGGPVLVHQAVKYLEDDGYKFLYGTTGLLILVLTILFRSIRWVAVPLIVVHATLIWTKAILSWSNIPLTMISSILTAMVTVIGIATVIHVIVNFREERKRSHPAEALQRTLATLAGPTFWTSATTAGGFGALMICEIAPVRTFGLMMCLGSMLVWVVSVVLLPGLALLPWGRDPSDAPGEELLGRYLATGLDHVARRPSRVALAGFVAGGGLLFGWLQLRVETDFTRNFRQSSEIVQAARFIEEKLSGSGLFEVNFTTAPRFDQAELDRLRQLEADLREVAGVTKVTGIVDLLDFLDQSSPGGSTGMNRFMRALVTRMPLSAKTELLNSTGVARPFWRTEAGRGRILLRASERATSDEKDRLIRAVGDVATGVLGAERRPVVTGYFVLLNHLVSRLLYDQRNTFALASVICLVMLILAFRNWRLGLIAMVPNVTPIVMVVGTMGWFGLPVNMATAMLSSVSIGMAVDSSIFYLSDFQRELRSGTGFDVALERTHLSVGRALSFANLAIVVGFSALVTSHFIPTIHFGILVSIALLGGLIGNLLLLPLMLRSRLAGMRPIDAVRSARS